MTMEAITTYIPGLRLFRNYRREWFQNDLVAGLSVAAVALPVGIAYAQLADFRRQSGSIPAYFLLWRMRSSDVEAARGQSRLCSVHNVGCNGGATGSRGCIALYRPFPVAHLYDGSRLPLGRNRKVGRYCQFPFLTYPYGLSERFSPEHYRQPARYTAPY